VGHFLCFVAFHSLSGSVGEHMALFFGLDGLGNYTADYTPGWEIGVWSLAGNTRIWLLCQGGRGGEGLDGPEYLENSSQLSKQKQQQHRHHHFLVRDKGLARIVQNCTK
jgi:hypothetical protein